MCQATRQLIMFRYHYTAVWRQECFHEGRASNTSSVGFHSQNYTQNPIPQESLPTIIAKNSNKILNVNRPSCVNTIRNSNHQPDATIFQFIILTFIYSSTCFGRCPTHHQELTDCSSSPWFYLRIVVTVVLCSWSGHDGRENARNMLSCK